jgi:hypothetical protein
MGSFCGASQFGTESLSPVIHRKPLRTPNSAATREVLQVSVSGNLGVGQYQGPKRPKVSDGAFWDARYLTVRRIGVDHL